jgi:hypothetical protein
MTVAPIGRVIRGMYVYARVRKVERYVWMYPAGSREKTSRARTGIPMTRKK